MSADPIAVPDSLLGLKVIESPYLEQDGTPYDVRRTWRQRLFSRPWRPFVTTYTVVPRVPLEGFVQLNPHTIVMHPVTLRRLKEQLR
jgi:hypothetical protein